MMQSAHERVTAAIDFNPLRDRVTIQRDDARALLADNQRLAAEARQFKQERDEAYAAVRDCGKLASDYARQLTERPSWTEIFAILALLPMTWTIAAVHATWPNLIYTHA